MRVCLYVCVSVCALLSLAICSRQNPPRRAPAVFWEVVMLKVRSYLLSPFCQLFSLPLESRTSSPGQPLPALLCGVPAPRGQKVSRALTAQVAPNCRISVSLSPPDQSLKPHSVSQDAILSPFLVPIELAGREGGYAWHVPVPQAFILGGVAEAQAVGW